jgi:S-adenosylmethionine synthetase
VAVDAVVIAAQHSPDVEVGQVCEDIKEHVIKAVVKEDWLHSGTEFHINRTGRFVVGGPMGDSGLTGRKIIVDTYGGAAPHGGGAFSGKDPTKVDRSASYMARYVAKNVVGAGLADKCLIQVAYAIGLDRPVSLYVETFGTNKVDERKIEEAVQDLFDLRPRSIIETLQLRRPVYRDTAAYGHFGRTGAGFTWEVVDKAEALLEAVGGVELSGRAYA